MRWACVVALLAACGGGLASTSGVSLETGAVLTLGQEVVGNTTGAADDFQPSCGAASGAGDEAWAFVAPEAGAYRFHVTSDYDAIVAVRTTGDAPRELGCNDDEGSKRQSSVAVELTAGQRVEVVVDGYWDAEGGYRLSVGRTETAVPEGRQGRLTLERAVDGSTSNGSDHATPSCGAQAGSPDHVWHFVPPEAGSYRFRVLADYDSVVSVVRADGSEIACNDDAGEVSESEVEVRLAAGEAVGVVVDGYRGHTGGYRLTASRSGAASGGGGGGAGVGAGGVPGGGVITLGQRVEGVTSGSTDRATPGCGARPGSPDDIWRFTPTSAGTYRIRVSARYDSVVALRDDNGTELACNDDHQGAVGESEVVVGLAAGRTFEIVVDGYDGNHGAYSLIVDDFTASGGVVSGPPNLSTATPAGALTIGRAVNDTTLGGDDRVTPSCGSQHGTPDDVWTFVAPRRGPFVFDVDAQYDAVLALYDANGIELECNDDHGTTQRSRVQPRLERGQTYYVVVDGYAGNSGAYRLSVARPRKPGR